MVQVVKFLLQSLLHEQQQGVFSLFNVEFLALPCEVFLILKNTSIEVFNVEIFELFNTLVGEKLTILFVIEYF